MTLLALNGEGASFQRVSLNEGARSPKPVGLEKAADLGLKLTNKHSVCVLSVTVQ